METCRSIGRYCDHFTDFFLENKKEPSCSRKVCFFEIIDERGDENKLITGPINRSMQDTDQVIREVDALPSQFENSLPGIIDAPPSYDEVMASNSQSNSLPKVD